MLGRYALIEEIASGGMATVYLGRARGVGGFERTVAVKCCAPQLRKDAEFASMFLDEARLAARIHHPNVVATLDVGDDEVLYLVMEYIDGDRMSDLRNVALQKHQRIPVPILLRIGIDALTGLHAAHETQEPDGRLLNLVHRDISPQNILVGCDGVTRILDFGIAKAEARATITRDGQVKGKLAYMAPEQVLSEEVTRRADIFAAGVVLWEALTAQRLFQGNSDAELMNRVLRAKIVPPSRVMADVPVALDAIVFKALERNASSRYATALEFAEALESMPDGKIATHRAVGSFVQELMAESVARRRALLAKVSAVPDAVIATEKRDVGGEWQASTVVEDAEPGSPGVYVMTDSDARRAQGKPRRWLVPSLILIGCVSAFAASVSILSKVPPPPMRHGDPTTLAAPAVAPVPVATPLVLVDAAPVVQPSLPEAARSAPAIETSPRSAVHHTNDRRRSRSHPGRRAHTSGGAGAAGTSEFHPDGI